MMGLEGIVVLFVIGIIRKDRSVGPSHHVSGGILGVLLLKGRVIVLILRDEQNPDEINRWDSRHATYVSQKVLHLVEDLCSGGSVKSQGGIFGLLVLGSSSILVTLL
jgi:hypothetical protein